VLDQPAREHRRDQGVAVGRRPDAEQELFGPGMLQQQPGSSRTQRVEDVLIDVEGGEHHHLGRVRAEREILRTASRPSIRGIRTSISTTSGRDLVTSLTAAIPSSASPTTSRSG
jgi:hypothetical protein